MEHLVIGAMFAVVAIMSVEAGRHAGYNAAIRAVAAKDRDALDEVIVEQIMIARRRRKEQAL